MPPSGNAAGEATIPPEIDEISAPIESIG
ncbi:hypothetical protein EMIT0111MI5_280045 [Burkholderia sp. IT-111MI5]